MSVNPWELVNPVVFTGRGFTPKEDCAFVLMPFRPNWSELVWQTIKETLKNMGIEAVRADEQYGHQVVEDIWKGICEAGIVIADVTGKNPNVYYELGIAHVLGRRVILLTQTPDDIPFDIRVYRHILYKVPFSKRGRMREMDSLSVEFKRTIEWIRENEPMPPGPSFADIYGAVNVSADEDGSKIEGFSEFKQSFDLYRQNIHRRTDDR